MAATELAHRASLATQPDPSAIIQAARTQGATLGVDVTVDQVSRSPLFCLPA